MRVITLIPKLIQRIMKKCPQTITIPDLIENNCPNGQVKTDCTIYEDAITYLSLPPNSTVTEVINALVTSLSDARSRVLDLEDGSEMIANKQNSLDEDGEGIKYPTVDAVNEGLALKADDDSVLHDTGVNNLDGRLVIQSTLNTALTVFSPDSDAINAITEEASGVALFAQNSGGGNIAVFDNSVDGNVVIINNAGDVTANSFIKEGGLSTEFLMADGSTSLGNTSLYTVYTAILSQTAAAAPVATELENSTGATLVWTRDATGAYRVTASAPIFTSAKTAINATVNYIGANISESALYGSRTSTTVCQFVTEVAGSSSDNILKDAFLEIRIYN